MMRNQKTKPIAVLISDIHYNIRTLEVATKVMQMAIDKANQLDITLIVCGDLHDSKANIRAECMIEMMDIFDTRFNKDTIILRGNHDSLHEKSEQHSLHFLDQYAHILDTYEEINGIHFIPYQHDIQQFKTFLDDIPKGATIIMHQGVLGSNAGHYLQDKSAIPKDWLKWYRGISGHYHKRQTIECGPLHGAYLGQLDYIGNPYSLGFGEANDPEKGFQILYDDGSLEFIPTRLRQHCIIECKLLNNRLIECNLDIPKDSILWVKVTGSSDNLALMTKLKIAQLLNITQAFKLDLIPTDTIIKTEAEINMPQAKILDSIIDDLTNTHNDRKLRLKNLWKEII